LEKRPLIAKEGNTKFTFHDEKFATELTKYLELTLKKLTQPTKILFTGRERKLPRHLDPLKSTKDSVERHKLAMLFRKT
jgi:hypothetical protein